MSHVREKYRMKETMEVVFGLLGGLAVFIYGMNLMSEGLQKAAGERMKKVLAILTKNPVMGVLAGALVTAVLQSSSATTVMVIGFVSAGLMQLPQAISVILGANIGTTMTAQLIAFKIDDLVWPIVFIGFLLQFFGKKEFIKNLGQTVFAFGLLFVGIITMGNVMKPLASSPVFTELMGKVSDIPILGVLLGTVMTLVVQSSSATIAVLQNFAMQAGPDGVTSIIGLTGAIPILLGDNIGTTITALLASVGQSKNAKRTAVAHSVFNITGSFVFLWIIPWFAKFIQWISPKGNEVEVISRQIANAHTTFNLVNTLIWLPLIWLMVKIVMKLVPGEESGELVPNRPSYIDTNLVGQPVFAIHLIRKEVIHMTKTVSRIVEKAGDVFLNRSPEAAKEVEQDAQNLAGVHEECVRYMSVLMSAGILTEEQARQTAAYLYLMNETERIGDCSAEIAEIAGRSGKKGCRFSKEAIKEIEDSLKAVVQMLGEIGDALYEGDEQAAQCVLDRRGEAFNVQGRLMKNHFERLEKGKCSPEFTAAFSTVLQGLDRMNHNCISIAEVIREEIHLKNIIQLDEEDRSMKLAATAK